MAFNALFATLWGRGHNKLVKASLYTTRGTKKGSILFYTSEVAQLLSTYLGLHGYVDYWNRFYVLWRHRNYRRIIIIIIILLLLDMSTTSFNTHHERVTPLLNVSCDDGIVGQDSVHVCSFSNS